MYRLARELLFRLDAERAHDLTMSSLALASRSEVALRALARGAASSDPRLAVTALGARFPNPIGLAAGLDKDGVAVRALAALGFGALELGSVTALPQPGNPKPRLFRLPQDEALINRMGFNNRGAKAVARRLAAARAAAASTGRGLPPVGVNVGKSRVVPASEAESDYATALSAVWHSADYLVINVSSPNTPGLRDLQAEEPLMRLLSTVSGVAARLGEKPLLLKLSPDLTAEQLRSAARIAEQRGLSGLIATNTTVSRPALGSEQDAAVRLEEGGLSGRPLAQLSLAALRTLRASTSLPVISVGGIFTAQDVIERLLNGATMVQVYTAFVYHGPGLIEELCRGLLKALDARGLEHVSELGQSSA